MRTYFFFPGLQLSIRNLTVATSSTIPSSFTAINKPSFSDPSWNSLLPGANILFILTQQFKSSSSPAEETSSEKSSQEKSSFFQFLIELSVYLYTFLNCDAESPSKKTFTLFVV